ncbi:hypothetical protein GJ744_003207 [Endocarpon pusillum]|uniref:Uncharacterized protein n=1 Tax=Endocarpon pusillum TaxID=364733 RepID=A0A8H7E676_9EURO|nr:hypothetical protein GJ744_003207 [Endocarpon pusillum]
MFRVVVVHCPISDLPEVVHLAFNRSAALKWNVRLQGTAQDRDAVRYVHQGTVQNRELALKEWFALKLLCCCKIFSSQRPKGFMIAQNKKNMREGLTVQRKEAQAALPSRRADQYRQLTLNMEYTVITEFGYC